MRCFKIFDDQSLWFKGLNSSEFYKRVFLANWNVLQNIFFIKLNLNTLKIY